MATDCAVRSRCRKGNICNAVGRCGQVMSCSEFDDIYDDNIEEMIFVQRGEKMRRKNAKELTKAWQKFLKEQEAKHGKH